MSINVPRSADILLVDSSGDSTSIQARKSSVSRYVLGTRERSKSVETNSARSQLCLPYKGRGVAAIIPIRQISTHVSRSQNPLGSLRVSTLYERSCRSNSLSKRHVVIRPNQLFNLFRANGGQFCSVQYWYSPQVLGSNKRLLSALRRVRVAQLPVPTRYANARMRKIDTSLQQKHTPRGKSLKNTLRTPVGKAEVL